MDILSFNDSLDEMFKNLDETYMSITDLETIILIFDSAKYMYIDDEAYGKDKFNNLSNIFCKIREDLFLSKNNLKMLNDRAFNEYYKLKNTIAANSN